MIHRKKTTFTPFTFLGISVFFFSLYALQGATVDRYGILHEAFFLLPTGYLFLFLFVGAYIRKVYPHITRYYKTKSQEHMKKSLLLFITCVLIGLGSYALLKVVIKPDTSSVSTHKKQAGGNIIKDTNDFYEISASYPMDARDKEKVIETFVTGIVKEKQEAWKIGGEAWASEKQVEKDFPDRPKMVYQLMIDYKTYQSKVKGTVSYVFTMYEFTGGAHGMTNLATFTFNDAGKVAIDQLLTLATNNNDIALTKLMKKKLETSLGEGTDARMLNDGLGLSYLKSDGVTFDAKACACDGFFFGSNFQNFIVKDEGITFLMGQYQVAPYAAGMPEVTFTWNELEKYLKR